MRSVPKVLEGARLPPRLRDLPQCPERVFLNGELPSAPVVAIVGTRKPTRRALTYAEDLAAELAGRGIAIASGGAEGIDAAAHRGALRSGGYTLVVAPSGYERPFPKEHRSLFHRVVELGGGYLSCHRPQQRAQLPYFFGRNAILAALCHVLVLVEAGVRSGARNTCRWARSLSRPYFTVVYPPWEKHGRGCGLELALGARPLLRTQDLLHALQSQGLSPVRTDTQELVPPPAQQQGLAWDASALAALGGAAAAAHQTPGKAASQPADKTAEQQLAYRALCAGATSLDDIALRTGLRIDQVQLALLELELGGSITQHASGAITVRSK